jgi:hypothetical protein
VQHGLAGIGIRQNPDFRILAIVMRPEKCFQFSEGGMSW